MTVGLVSDDRNHEIDFELSEMRSTSLLPSVIEMVMKRSQVGFDSLSGIVCGIGPGSFTGIRGAVTVARTVGLFIPGVKLFAANSLEAIYHVNQLPVVARSRTQEFFLWDKDGLRLVEALPNHPWVGPMKLEEFSWEKLTPAERRMHVPEPLALCKVGKGPLSWNDVTPLYTRPSYAEENLSRKHS